MMCRLSDKAVKAISAHGRIFEVGGAVRDRLLELPVGKDRDYLVTGIPFDQLTGILTRFGKVDLVGKSFGVIKFTQFAPGSQHTFDIALPRSEFSTGAGHKDFAVNCDPYMPIETDLQRRDFTINAMARSLDSDELVDPLSGQADLRNRQLRMTSEDSFVDDPLRMLRAVQFAARFEFRIEPKTLEAIKANAHLIQTVSAERIAEELIKLLERAARPSEGFRIMLNTGLLKHVIPELAACAGVDQPGGFHAYDVFEHTLHTIDAAPPRKRLRLAALFHDITKPQHKQLTDDGGSSYYGHEASGATVAKRVMNRLRFSKDLTDEVSTLIKRHMFTTDVTDKGLRRLIRWLGDELIYDLLDLRRADIIGLGKNNNADDIDQFETEIREEILRKPPLSVSDLVIDGNDIMREFKLPPSPLVGSTLSHLLEAVLDNPEHNSAEHLYGLAQEYITTHKES